MNPNNLRLRARWIVQDYRQGYKLWRIARDRGCTVDNVITVLIERGLLDARCVEFVKLRGR